MRDVTIYAGWDIYLNFEKSHLTGAVIRQVRLLTIKFFSAFSFSRFSLI